MRLSKQLFFLIFLIFFLLFTGNFIISVISFKNYLELESNKKANDMAISLGMALKPYMNNKYDPQIESIIRAIANNSSYKEIRLENSEFRFNSSKLLQDTKLDLSYKIKDISIDKKDGVLISLKDNNQNINGDIIYSFIPSKNFKSDKLNITFTAIKDKVKNKIKLDMKLDKVLVKITNKQNFNKVPKSFIDILPFNTKEVKAKILNGSKLKAILYINVDKTEAYLKIFQQAKNILIYSVITFIISLILLSVFLKFLLNPLADIKDIVKQIYNGQFKKIQTLPWTTELKDLSISMNNMSMSVENTINELNTNLEKLKYRLSQDQLTGLQVEQSFTKDMKEILTSRHNGYMFSIKIDDLVGFAKINSQEIVNEFLKEFANILKSLDEDVVAYRFYGSSFALVAKDIDSEKFKEIIINLKDQFSNLSKKFDKVNIANIGVSSFDFLSDTDIVISSAKEAYEMARQIGNNEVYVNENNKLVRDSKQWKELVFDIVDNDKFEINFVNETIDLNDKNKILMKEIFVNVKDEQNNDISIGIFISLAQKYEKIIDLDKKAILKIIQLIKDNNIKHEVLINISFYSMIDNNFNSWLKKTLDENTQLSKYLVFALTAYGTTRDMDNFKTFIDNIHKSNAKVMIKRYETKLVPLNNLKELKIDYIRLARDYTIDINQNTTHQNYIASIYEVTELCNIKIIAESVKSDDDFEYLKGVGLFGVNRD